MFTESHLAGLKESRLRQVKDIVEQNGVPKELQVGNRWVPVWLSDQTGSTILERLRRQGKSDFNREVWAWKWVQ